MTQPSISVKRRRRGGQPNHQNALERGLYARAFRAGELNDLDAMMAEGLQNEITMLRAITRRVIETISEDASQKEAVMALGALGLAATRLATLLKTQKLLDGQEQQTANALNQALAEVVKELGIHD